MIDEIIKRYELSEQDVGLLINRIARGDVLLGFVVSRMRDREDYEREFERQVYRFVEERRQR